MKWVPFLPCRSRALTFVATAVVLAGCASSSQSTYAIDPAARPMLDMSTSPPNPDPRPGLKGGWFDAGQAAWNMRLLGSGRPPEALLDTVVRQDLWSTDLAFTGHYAIQGNYTGLVFWDASNPRAPRIVTTIVCPSSQADVAVYRQLLFVSSQDNAGRTDCGTQGVPAPVSPDRFKGLRIYDISDIKTPKYLTGVQACRGTHTITLVEDPNDRNNVYVYLSGVGRTRVQEVPGCVEGDPTTVPTTSRFTIDIVQVPLANPAQARVVSKPTILAGLGAVGRHAELDRDTDAAAGGGRGGGNPAPGAPRPPRGLSPLVSACHDITVFPALRLAGAACLGYGVLLDISDPKNPTRITAVSDTNFVVWHSATFSNDGTRVLFTDEWGQFVLPRCRSTDSKIWGSNSIFRIENRERLVHEGYYKLPVHQGNLENCTSHNGSPIPVPDREILVQGWLQGGTSVLDWTDATNLKEIAFFDRGPLDSTRLVVGGIWSAYWHNGYIYTSDAARGLDVLELQPSGFLSQNEIDAAKTVVFDQYNPQTQPKFVWPPTFALARAYLDQLARNNGLSAVRRAAVTQELAAAERLSESARRAPLSALATQLDREVAQAADARKVRLLADAIRQLSSK